MDDTFNIGVTDVDFCHFQFFIFGDAFCMISSKLENKSEHPQNIVNNAVKICIECGSVTVAIVLNKIICNECDSQFEMEDKD